MLPINKSDVCRRMLDTGKYQLSSSKIVEDVWLIAWLKSKGIGYDDAFEKWKRIYITRHPDDETAKSVFDKLWMNSRRTRFINKYKPIVFYQQEIDDIVAANIPVWQKEAIALMYAVAKTVGSSELDVLPMSDIVRMTSLVCYHHGYEIDSVLENAQKFGFVRFKTTKLWDNASGEYDTFLRYAFPHIQVSGDIYKEIKSVLDVPENIFEALSVSVCVDCGRLFKQKIIGRRQKEPRCPECYVQYVQIKEKKRLSHC